MILGVLLQNTVDEGEVSRGIDEMRLATSGPDKLLHGYKGGSFIICA